MKNILIVSEIDIISKTIEDFCHASGGNTKQVVKASAAIDLLFSQKFDLIVCSVFLADFDGVQLINIIKNSCALNNKTPIILMTSNAGVEELFSSSTKPDLIILKDGKFVEKFKNFYNSLTIKTDVQKTKVLYIDDDPFIQKIIKSWFAKIDSLDLTFFGSISELKQAKNLDHDYIVSDNLLKDGDIFDVLSYIQTSPLKDKPILVYTGSTDKLHINELQTRANVLALLEKPFDMTHFLQLVSDRES